MKHNDTLKPDSLRTMKVGKGLTDCFKICKGLVHMSVGNFAKAQLRRVQTRPVVNTPFVSQSIRTSFFFLFWPIIRELEPCGHLHRDHELQIQSGCWVLWCRNIGETKVTQIFKACVLLQSKIGPWMEWWMLISDPDRSAFGVRFPPGHHRVRSKSSRGVERFALFLTVSIFCVCCTLLEKQTTTTTIPAPGCISDKNERVR